MRPASRQFRAGLLEKVARLERRVEEAAAGRLASGQNPGFDRLAEAQYLLGRADEARRNARRAAQYWSDQLSSAISDATRCEPAFHLGSAYLFAGEEAQTQAAFERGVELYAASGLAGSDDTAYMAAVAGQLRRAEVVFHAATVADMTAQGMSDLKRFAERFPDTPRLLKLQFVQGLQRRDANLLSQMRLMVRWLTPEPEGITSFRTEEWLFAAHQVALAQLKRGEEPRVGLYDKDVELGLKVQ